MLSRYRKLVQSFIAADFLIAKDWTAIKDASLTVGFTDETCAFVNMPYVTKYNWVSLLPARQMLTLSCTVMQMFY